MNRRGSLWAWCSWVLIGVAALVMAPWAGAAEGEGPAQPAWGINALHTIAIHSVGFHPDTDWQRWTSIDVLDEGRYLHADVTPGTFHAPLLLPTGALVMQMALDGCDDNATKNIVYSIVSDTRGTGGTFVEAAGSTMDTSGCVLGSWVLGVPLQIDNGQYSYYLEVKLPGEYDTRFKAMRVQYMLQVSPAPATATFDDVPTDHWAFQHIEALADSEITAGCSETSFCPDAALTRAQMAVFLAKALGLSWDSTW